MLQPPLQEELAPPEAAAMSADAQRFLDLAKLYGAVGNDGTYQGFWSDPFCFRDFTRSALVSALPRVFFAYACFFSGLYINSLSQAWLQRNIAGYYESKCPGPGHSTLWDVIFEFMPYVNNTHIVDMFAASPSNVLVIRFIVLPGPLSLRWTILCRWLFVWGTIWMARSVTIIVTPLPNPDQTCKPRITYPDNLFLEAWRISQAKDITCQDVLFSGHAVGLAISTLFIVKYISLAPWTSWEVSRSWVSVNMAVTAVGFGWILTGCYFIIASHFHYTIDVIVGALVTFTLFKVYHSRLELAWLRKVHGGSGILEPFFYWYERDAKDLRKYSAVPAGSSERSIELRNVCSSRNATLTDSFYSV